MLDFSWSEIALIVVVAIVFIGPKDLPAAIRSVTRGIRALRRMAAEFQGHIDDMVQEADLSETHHQLKQLRNVGLKERLIRAVDPERELERQFTLAPPLSLASPLLSPQGVPLAKAPKTEDMGRLAGYDSLRDGEDLEALLKAPSILPPSVARCLLSQERYWAARPAILPPYCVLHDKCRVVLSCTSLQEPPGTKPPL